MASRIDQERVQALLRRIAKNDRAIGEQIGVAQSTIWRLRNKKITKVTRYIEALSRIAGLPANDADELNYYELAALAEESPGLKAVLVSLARFMREKA